MPGARGGRPGPPLPGQPGGEGRREPSGSMAVGLLLAQRGTAAHHSEKPRCSIRKGSLPRTNDGALRIREDLTKAVYAPFTPESPDARTSSTHQRPRRAQHVLRQLQFHQQSQHIHEEIQGMGQ